MGQPVALTLAGSDSGSGAGIQGDLKTFAALGVYGVSAITAITAQNTERVACVHPLPVPVVEAQWQALFDDFQVDSVKIGMLATKAIVESVAQLLEEDSLSAVVIDPVFCSSSGSELLETSAIELFREAIVARATVLTPNIVEAAILLQCTEAEIEKDPEASCRALVHLGARAVVITGGHSGGSSSDDWLFDAEGFCVFEAPKISTENTHGSGCAFSSAVAAMLARGETVRSAVAAAKRFVRAAIEAGAQLGVGHGPGPLNHLPMLDSKRLVSAPNLARITS